MLSSFPQNVKRGILDLVSSILASLIHFALAHPTLKAWALAFVRRFPALEARLSRFVMTRGIIAGGITLQISSKVPYELSTELSRLTPSARRNYTDLKAAIERHNKGGK